MNFYQQLGFLVFGSRLKRLGDSFIADINKVYKTHKIPFDASWFPIFYILSRQKEVTIREIADELNTSHSAASQMVSSLQEKGLIHSEVSADDARKKVITFTAKGEKLQQKIEPVWAALQQAMEAMATEGKHSKYILQSLEEIENNAQEKSLYERIEDKLKD